MAKSKAYVLARKASLRTGKLALKRGDSITEEQYEALPDKFKLYFAEKGSKPAKEVEKEIKFGGKSEKGSKPAKEVEKEIKFGGKSEKGSKPEENSEIPE